MADELTAGKRKRPARKQADEIDTPFINTEGREYNIWYGKYLGDRPDKRMKPTNPRCRPSTDSGETKADLMASKQHQYICLYFARGKCIQGANCTYYHRIPTAEDEKTLPLTNDIFGRDRHATDREDMGGTGNFNRESKTLYLGGVKRPAGGGNLERVLKEVCEEYGPVEYVRIIWGKMIAFVRFTLRSSAEFAKEALADQDIGNGETLNVRWAHDDPNPTAKVATEMRVTQQAVEAISSTFREEGVPEYLYAEQAAAADPVPYPHPYSEEFQQYQQAIGGTSSGGYYARQMANYLRYMQQYRQEYLQIASEHLKPEYQQQALGSDGGSTPAIGGYKWVQEGQDGQATTADYSYPNTDAQYPQGSTAAGDQASYDYYAAWAAYYAAAGAAGGGGAAATAGTTAATAATTNDTPPASSTASSSSTEPSVTSKATANAAASSDDDGEDDGEQQDEQARLHAERVKKALGY